MVVAAVAFSRFATISEKYDTKMILDFVIVELLIECRYT